MADSHICECNYVVMQMSLRNTGNILLQCKNPKKGI